MIIQCLYWLFLAIDEREVEKEEYEKTQTQEKTEQKVIPLWFGSSIIHTIHYLNGQSEFWFAGYIMGQIYYMEMGKKRGELVAVYD